MYYSCSWTLTLDSCLRRNDNGTRGFQSWIADQARNDKGDRNDNCLKIKNLNLFKNYKIKN